MWLKSRLKKKIITPHFQGRNCYWTNKYNQINCFFIYILLRILMDIVRDCVSWFVMLCQAFTATDFSCCLFVGLSAFSFVFSKWNKCSIRLKSGDWLGHCRIFHLFTFKELLLLYVLGIFWSPFVLWSAAQSTLLHLAESGQRVHPYTLQNSSVCFCPLWRLQ